MTTDIIVSYDGTSNDDDALALGRMLARAGASLALAYVRHAREFDPAREELAQHDAERRLQHGAAWLNAPETPQHVVLSASTGEGLAKLAETEEAAVVVFGSDYRTPPGRVEPGTSAQHLLEGGPVAIGVAPAGLRTNDDVVIEKIAVLGSDDDAATQTVQSLSDKLGATVVEVDGGDPDLIVVGSRPNVPIGHVALSGTIRSGLDRARSSVLVVPHGKPVLL
jgi:nucleotide-binding universal stress UspA family protein